MGASEAEARRSWLGGSVGLNDTVRASDDL